MVMEEEETIADDIKSDNLENEDALTGIGSSLQASRPFPFHGGKGTSRELAKAGYSDTSSSYPRSQQRQAALPSRPMSQGEQGVLLMCSKSC